MALDKVDFKMVDGSEVQVPVHADDSARNSAISSPVNGMIIYNTAASALQQYNGGWSTIAPAPTIGSVSGTINEDTNTTLTVNGSQYIAGMTVKLVLVSNSTPISGHTALSYTLVSSTQITVTIPTATTNIAAGSVVQLEITKSGLVAKSSSITVSEDPNWTTAAGTVATIFNDLGTSQTVATLAATAGAGGGTLNYASDDNTLDTTYFALNLTSGVITTHASTALTGITSTNITEAFNANAKISGDATKNTVRAFNIIVNKRPVGGTVTTSGLYTIHSFTTVGTTQFVTYSQLTGVEYLMIAGGGEGGSHSTTVNYADGGNGGVTTFKVQGAGSNLVHCIGGGGGASHGGTSARDGGSGGGGAGVAGAAAKSTGGEATANQGYTGGDGRTTNNPYPGGGGGGAGSTGQTHSSSTQSGAGGVGLTSSITGSAVKRAGGGGSGNWNTQGEVWAYGGAWAGTSGTNKTSGSLSGGTGGVGASNQAYGAGNGGEDTVGGAGGANTGAGGGGGDTGGGAGHGGGGAGGYQCTVAGETSGGGQTANALRATTFTTLGSTGATTTYDCIVGAGGTGASHGGDGGSGIIIIRYLTNP